MARRAQPFKYRGAWRAQVTLKNGTRPFRDFTSHGDAGDWITDQLAKANTETLPELGGPGQASLAEALAHYAGLNTITKGGYSAEIDRINHYLEGADIKPLKIVTIDGKRQLILKETKKLPSAFKANKDTLLHKREGTYKLIAALGRRKCSTLCTADFRRLMVSMKNEGLSDSTIQKEIALLKHLFNIVAAEWNWKGFDNPCAGLKLGGSNQRFVFMTQEQRVALRQALAQCDNPYFWPLVEVCMQTTLRKGTKALQDCAAMERAIVAVLRQMAPDMEPGETHDLNVRLLTQNIKDEDDRFSSIHPDIVTRLLRGLADDGRRDRESGTIKLVKRGESGTDLVDLRELMEWLEKRPDSPWRDLLLEGLQAYRLESGFKKAPPNLFIDWLAEWGRELRRKQTGLLLLTAHSAKGLEFDNVAILDGRWLSGVDNTEVDEARRLFYVAMTRAKTSLTIAAIGTHPFERELVSTSAVFPREIHPPAELPQGVCHRYILAQLKQVDIGYAGRRPRGHPVHQNLAKLQPGSPLSLQHDGKKFILYDSSGNEVGYMAKSFAVPTGMQCLQASVYALHTRWKEDVSEPYQVTLRCGVWEVVVPELVFG